MLTLIMMILMISVFLKLFGFAIRAAWGLTRMILTFLFFPVVLTVMIFSGLIYIALPIILVVGLMSLVAKAA